MKNRHYLLTLLAALALTGCYNDDDLWDKVNEQDERIAALEKWQTQVNSDIATFRTLIDGKSYITSVTPVNENGQTGQKISYITLTDGKAGPEQSFTLYNGKAGAASEMPVISARQEADGKWYWTLNGELLKDNDGNKVPATGDKGETGATGATGATGETGATGATGAAGTSAPTPQLSTGANLPSGATVTPSPKDDNAIYLSIDGGQNWTKVSGDKGETGAQGPQGATGATGATGQQGPAGANGTSLFQSVTYKDATGAELDYITFVLADNTPDDEMDNPTFTVPRYKHPALTFTHNSVAITDLNTTLDITRIASSATDNVLTYSITGATTEEEANLRVLAFVTDNNDWNVTTDRTAKTITVTPTPGLGTTTATLAVLLTENGVAVRTYMLTLKHTDFKGKGTEANPYAISTADELWLLAKKVNAGNWYMDKYFQLTRDIDLENKEWTPIGFDDNGFGGNFSGKKSSGGNYTISGLKINQTATEYSQYGLFGYFANSSSGATISNVTVSGSITINATAEVYAGGIAGVCGATTNIKDCTSRCTIEVTGTGSIRTGGIAGKLDISISNIENCRNEGDITIKGESATTGKTVAAGAIIGHDYTAKLTMSGCTNKGTIKDEMTGTAPNIKAIGGLIGYAEHTSDDRTDHNAILTNCSNEAATGAGSIIKLYSINYGRTITIKANASDAGTTLDSSSGAGTGTYPATD